MNNQTQRRYADGALSCLAIEDSYHDQEMIRRAMKGARIEADIQFETSISSARKALAQKQFSMILCDNGLPDGCGSEFAQELSKRSILRDTPIVIVSGWPSPFMWSKARSAGLQVIDKNDNPMLKLRDMFRQKFRTPANQPG